MSRRESGLVIVAVSCRSENHHTSISHASNPMADCRAFLGILIPEDLCLTRRFARLSSAPETHPIPKSEPKGHRTKCGKADNHAGLSHLVEDQITISFTSDTVHLLSPPLLLESRRGAPNSSAGAASSLGKQLRSSSTGTWMIQAPLLMPTGPLATGTFPTDRAGRGT